MLEKKKSYCGGNIVIEVGNKRNAWKEEILMWRNIIKLSELGYFRQPIVD